jgi:hypothetical protein
VSGQAFATVNGDRIVSGSLNIPLYGIWAADFVCVSTQTFTNPVSVVIGNLTLTGAVYRQGGFSGSQYVRLVGGAAGWRTTVQAQAYNNPNAVRLSTVLKDAAAAVGEQINVQTDQVIGSFFVRENAPAERLLRQLCGPLWFMDTTGTTQVGTRPQSTVSTPYLVQSWDAGKNLFVISTEDYASWLPNNQFSNDLVTSTQTISMTRFDVDNKGTLRLSVLGSP